MNIKQLPKGTVLLSYDKLSDEAKEKARLEIILDDIHNQSTKMFRHKRAIKNNIHFCVNDNTKIPRLIRRQKHIDRVINDIDYCERYIIENVCQFTTNGNYITFMS